MSLGTSNSVFRYENAQSCVINTQTDNYTLTPDDNGACVVINAAAGKNVTVPVNLPIGFSCIVIQAGAGQVTFVESSTNVDNVSGHTKTSGQYAAVSLISHAADSFILAGSTAA